MDEWEDKVTSTAIKIIIGTGIRRGEACGLRAEDFSSEKKELKITQSIVYAENEVLKKSPKTNSGLRTIVLPDGLVEVIEERIRENTLNRLRLGRKYKDNGLIICNDDGTPINPNNLYNRYRRFMEKHADEIRFLSLHQIRHSFASLAVSYNTDIKALQETLGHSDAMTTLNTYSHGYREAKQKQAMALDINIFQSDAF